MSSPIKLKVKHSRAVLFLALFIAIGIASPLVIADKPIFGSLMLVFAILGSVAFAVQLIPNRCFLELNRDGFICATGFGKTTYQWRDIKEFGAISIQANEMIAWSYSDAYAGKKKCVMNACFMSGYDVAIPNIYQISTLELVRLMRAIKAESTSFEDDGNRGICFRSHPLA